MLIDKIDLFRRQFNVYRLCVLDGLPRVPRSYQCHGDARPFDGPADDQLRQRCALALGEGPDEAQEGVNARNVVRLVELRGGAVIACFKFVVRPDLPGESLVAAGCTPGCLCCSPCSQAPALFRCVRSTMLKGTWLEASLITAPPFSSAPRCSCKHRLRGSFPVPASAVPLQRFLR